MRSASRCNGVRPSNNHSARSRRGNQPRAKPYESERFDRTPILAASNATNRETRSLIVIRAAETSIQHRNNVVPQVLRRCLARVSLISALSDRPNIRRRPWKLADIDPRALVIAPVWRHAPLLKPAPAVAFDYSDLVLSGLLEQTRAIWCTGHIYSKPESPRTGQRFRARPADGRADHGFMETWTGAEIDELAQAIEAAGRSFYVRRMMQRLGRGEISPRTAAYECLNFIASPSSRPIECSKDLRREARA
jgi:hypothetical protein